MSTYAEQNATDFAVKMSAEAVEHAERHGFEADHEDYDGWVFVGNGHRDGVFRVLGPGRAQVEVVGMSSSVSEQTIDVARCMGGVHPDAVFMDVLEDALVAAKRACSC